MILWSTAFSRCNFTNKETATILTCMRKRPLFGLQVECRLKHYASCHFLGSLGLGLPTQYACRPIWPSRRNGEEASPFRDLLPLDTEINFTNALCRCTQMSRQENIGSASGSPDFARFGSGGSTLSRFPCKTPIGKVGTSQYTVVTRKLA